MNVSCASFSTGSTDLAASQVRQVSAGIRGQQDNESRSLERDVSPTSGETVTYCIIIWSQQRDVRQVFEQHLQVKVAREVSQDPGGDSPDKGCRAEQSWRASRTSQQSRLALLCQCVELSVWSQCLCR